MKRLYLMRHTQSSHGTVMSADDHGRDLTECGQIDAKNMGNYIQNNHKIPSFALVSNAKRTQETWEIIQQNQPFKAIPKIDDPNLYLCDRHYMLEAIQNLDNKYQSAIIIGHYPAIQECAIAFTSKDPHNLITNLSGIFSSGTLVTLDIPTKNWADAKTHSAILQDYTPPESLR